MPPQRYDPLSRPVKGPGLGLAVRKPGERRSPFSHLAEGVLPGAAAATASVSASPGGSVLQDRANSDAHVGAGTAAVPPC